MKNCNSFSPLLYGREDIFRGMDPYLDSEGLRDMLELFKGCMVNHDTPEAILEAVRTLITPMKFASGSMVK